MHTPGRRALGAGGTAVTGAEGAGRQRGEGTREGEQILAFMLSKKGRHWCL